MAERQMRFALPLAFVAGLALLGCAGEAPYGDWVFKSPDCPGAYSNCQDTPTQAESMLLFPDVQLSAYGVWRPLMEVTCWEDEPFVMLFAGDPSFFKEGTASIKFTVEGRNQHGSYSVATDGGWVVSLAATDALEVVGLLTMADEARRDIDVELRSYGDRDQYGYSVAGFDRNYQRLPCSG